MVIFEAAPTLVATAIFDFVRRVFFAVFPPVRLVVPNRFSDCRLAGLVAIDASVSVGLGRDFRGSAAGESD